MNFLVGRILRVLEEARKVEKQLAPETETSTQDDVSIYLEDEKDEEEAFWIFAMTLEAILPIDYYSNMVGVLIDQKIFYDIFKAEIPDLCSHLSSVGFDPSLLAF